MANIVVAYHSGHGHTAELAKAVVRGLESVAGTTVTLVNVDDLKGDFTALNAADGIVFGCPTYMGGPSAQFKAFIDAASPIWYQRLWKDKLAAGFTNSGTLSGDKQNTLTSLWVNAMQHGMIWVSQGELSAGTSPTDVNRLGSYGGAMSQSDLKKPPTEAPPAGDLKTGELLGKRFAEITARFVRK
jgi:NAD(P)H dehydrogenase (quinone)